MELMTQAAFARHRGAVKSAATNWKNAGLLVFAEGPNGKPMVDVARSDARLNGKLDPMRGRPSTGTSAEAPPARLPLEASPPPTSPPAAPAGDRRSLADERVDQVREQRIGNALKNAQLAGDLVPLVDAERRVSEAGRAARERMQAWLRGIAERFAATSDLRTIMAIGEEGIDQVFAELASAAANGEFAGDEDELTPEETAEIEAAAEAEEVTEAAA